MLAINSLSWVSVDSKKIKNSGCASHPSQFPQITNIFGNSEWNDLSYSEIAQKAPGGVPGHS